MTPAQEDMALRSCHPLYNEFCREEKYEGDYDEEEEEDAELGS